MSNNNFDHLNIAGMAHSALSVSRLQDALDRQQALFDKISNIGAVTNLLYLYPDCTMLLIGSKHCLTSHKNTLKDTKPSKKEYKNSLKRLTSDNVNK